MWQNQPAPGGTAAGAATSGSATAGATTGAGATGAAMGAAAGAAQAMQPHKSNQARIAPMTSTRPRRVNFPALVWSG
jgi:hypothetical protein